MRDRYGGGGTVSPGLYQSAASRVGATRTALREQGMPVAPAICAIATEDRRSPSARLSSAISINWGVELKALVGVHRNVFIRQVPGPTVQGCPQPAEPAQFAGSGTSPPAGLACGSGQRTRR